MPFLIELLREKVAHMTKWMEHEKQAIRMLIGERLPKNVLEDVLGSDRCVLDYDGHGYCVTAEDDRLPVERDVFDGPANDFLIGSSPSRLECGYVVFVMNRQLTLDCHPWGDPLPPEFRESKVDIRLSPKGKTAPRR